MVSFSLSDSVIILHPYSSSRGCFLSITQMLMLWYMLTKQKRTLNNISTRPPSCHEYIILIYLYIHTILFFFPSLSLWGLTGDFLFSFLPPCIQRSLPVFIPSIRRPSFSKHPYCFLSFRSTWHPIVTALTLPTLTLSLCQYFSFTPGSVSTTKSLYTLHPIPTSLFKLFPPSYTYPTLT